MQVCSIPTPGEIAHSKTAPQVPSAPMENPSDAIRKPGLHRAITNPSHQRSALSSCRSSTNASAIWAPPFTPGKRCLARVKSPCLYDPGNRRVTPLVEGEVTIRSGQGPFRAWRAVRAAVKGLHCQHARRTAHRSLRLRRDRTRAARRTVVVLPVRAHLERRPDPGRGVLEDHAGHAADAPVRDRHGSGPGGPGRRAHAFRRDQDLAAAAGADELLVHVLHAQVASPGPGAGQEPAQVEAPPGVTGFGGQLPGRGRIILWLNLVSPEWMTCDPVSPCAGGPPRTGAPRRPSSGLSPGGPGP